MTRRSLIVLLATILTGCGGGGGSAAVAPPALHRTDLLYGYFGSADNPAGPWLPPTPGLPDSTVETAAHVNVVMTNGWCDWATSAGRQSCADRALRTINEGRTLGVHRFIVSVDFLLWNADGSTRPGAVGEVQAFLLTIGRAGALDDVVAVYPMDEPNTRIGGGAAQRDTFLALHAMLAQLPETAHIAMMAIYAPLRFGTLNMDVFDWIAVDDYEAGTNVFAEIEQIPAGKHRWLVPGGAAPWLADPAPYRAYADAHSEVMGIMPFLWIDHSQAGIRNAPTHQAYVTLGCSLTARCQ